MYCVQNISFNFNNKIEYKNKFQVSTAFGGLVTSAPFFTGTH